MTDPSNEVIWLTYEAVVSEVEEEYAGKFDSTEADKQWAVAWLMFMAGKQSQKAIAQRMYREMTELLENEVMK